MTIYLEMANVCLSDGETQVLFYSTCPWSNSEIVTDFRIIFLLQASNRLGIPH